MSKFGTFNTGNVKADNSLEKLTYNPKGHTYDGPNKDCYSNQGLGYLKPDNMSHDEFASTYNQRV